MHTDRALLGASERYGERAARPSRVIRDIREDPRNPRQLCGTISGYQHLLVLYDLMVYMTNEYKCLWIIDTISPHLESLQRQSGCDANISHTLSFANHL